MRQQTHDFGLEPVRILILINHDVAIGMGETFGDLRVGAQQFAQMGQQIVVVEQAAFAFILPVIFLNLAEGVEFGKQMGKL